MDRASRSRHAGRVASIPLRIDHQAIRIGHGFGDGNGVATRPPRRSRDALAITERKGPAATIHTFERGLNERGQRFMASLGGDPWAEAYVAGKFLKDVPTRRPRGGQRVDRPR